MFNKVILIGTLNTPVTTKQINPQLELGTLTLTVERTYPKQGVPFTETSLIDCDLWGKQIEEANKFDAGSTIIVEGRLRSRRTPNLKTGGESCFLSVTVEKMRGLDEHDKPQQTMSNPERSEGASSELDRFKQTTVDVPAELPF
jgi:single-stranded DNA-binding protein